MPRLRKTRPASHLKEQTPYYRHEKMAKTRNGTLVAQKLVNELESLFLKASNPLDACSMKKYMRNQFDFFGVKTPQRKHICKQVFSEKTVLSTECVLSTVKLLWLREQREFQYSGTDLLVTHKTMLSADINICQQSAGVVEQLITEKSWWDTVDALASNVVGHMVLTQPGYMRPLLDEWIISENMWLRRTAILHQLKYKQLTDKEILFRYCLQCCKETEFFIQKAIGWALREFHKTQPDAVKEFVMHNKTRLSKLSVREALKHEKIP